MGWVLGWAALGGVGRRDRPNSFHPSNSYSSSTQSIRGVIHRFQLPLTSPHGGLVSCYTEELATRGRILTNSA